MKRLIAYLPVNVLPFLALPVMATTCEALTESCAAAVPAPPTSITANAATAAMSVMRDLDIPYLRDKWFWTSPSFHAPSRSKSKLFDLVATALLPDRKP